MLTYEMTGLDELRRKFDPKMINKALDRAQQVAATKARTRISKEIRQLYNVKAGDVGKSVRLQRIQNGRLLIYTGRMIGLDKFGARPKKVKTKHGRRTGVSVVVRKTGGRKVVKHGFIGNVHGAKIFKRETDARLPIRRLFGPSIAHMAGNEVVGNLAMLQVQEDAGIEFDRYLTYLMDKAK